MATGLVAVTATGASLAASSAGPEPVPVTLEAAAGDVPRDVTQDAEARAEREAASAVSRAQERMALEEAGPSLQEERRIAEEQRAAAQEEARRAAEAEAARQAEEAAREAERQAQVAAAVADPKSVARSLVAERGWSGEQFSCLERLWTKESGWKHTADNPTSSAYGIPQALPGKKMASAGADWESNPVTQIRWGLGYIDDVYGTPCSAWAHSQRVNWY